MEKVVSLEKYKSDKRAAVRREHIRSVSTVVLAAEFIVPFSILVGIVVFFFSLEEVAAWLF
ncbi:hypothetical protein [Bacillus marinisedimentorum]|uniref:hypothetical protein n=1 Tax=Bacillus marinisedimentorum TaxID=1821260 RepID=UPI0007DF9606|nr:hypothetical protein [Bacillus marinisedimentorum]